MIEQWTNKVIADPKQLFLLDGLGALVSAFLIGVLLVYLSSSIGMPVRVLYFLAVIPCLFTIYDFYCYLKVAKNWSFYIKIIATANLLYCVLSLGLLVEHYDKLTVWGVIYFVVELIVIIALVIWEFQIAARLKNQI